MKRALIVTASVAALAVPGFASAAQVAHFNGSGATAAAHYSDGTSSIDISVQQSGSSAFLFLTMSSCTDTATSFSCSGTTVYGNLGASEFTVHGRNATLNTNGATLSGSTFSFGCDTTTWNCTFNDTPFTGGTIALAWTKTSEFSFRTSGTTTADFVNYTTTTTGTSNYNTSSVSGTILGIPFASSGNLGTSTNVSITVNKVH